MAAVTKKENFHSVSYTYTIETDRKATNNKNLPAVLRFDYTAHKAGVEIEVVEHFMKLEGIQGKILSAVVQANDGKIVGDNNKVLIRSVDAWMKDTSGGSKVDTTQLERTLEEKKRLKEEKLKEYRAEKDDFLKGDLKTEIAALTGVINNLEAKIADLMTGKEEKTDSKAGINTEADDGNPF